MMVDETGVGQDCRPFVLEHAFQFFAENQRTEVRHGDRVKCDGEACCGLRLQRRVVAQTRNVTFDILSKS